MGISVTLTVNQVLLGRTSSVDVARQYRAEKLDFVSVPLMIVMIIVTS